MAALISFLVTAAGLAFALYFLTRADTNAEQRMSHFVFVVIGVGVAVLGGIGLLVSLVWMAVRVAGAGL